MDNCFYMFVAFLAIVLAVIALSRSGTSSENQKSIQRLREELESLRAKVNALEKRLLVQQRDGQSAMESGPAPVPLPKPEPPPKPMEERVMVVPAAPAKNALEEKWAILSAEEASAPVIVPPPVIQKPVPEAVTPVLPPPVPAIAAIPEPIPAVVSTPTVVPPPPVSIARPMPPRLPVVPPPPAKSWNLEDLLGTQVFLKVGVAILVIGVVFAMGLVFQKMGPLGKLLMSYGGGVALLVGGLQAEKRERYRTFGRALIAGAWGILYFVTFAAGFIDAARVLHDRVAAVTALILAAVACVGFSLRYRNEWTTTSAFLLIYLSLGISAHEAEPVFNLCATLVVAVAMGVLIWRTGWLRLLGLGIPATWITFMLWVFSRLEGQAQLPVLFVFAACAAVFQFALLATPSEGERRAWQALGQISNFLGGLGLSLALAPRETAWIWALVYGLAHIGVAWAYQRKGERGLYLLTATEALAALALVSPLRLGLKHHLTPFMRLIGIELLLVAGVVLKERYFRILAYGAFLLTVLEILIIRVDVAGRPDAVLVGVMAGVALLNAALLQNLWKEIAKNELPGMAWAFTSTGTLLLSVLVWLKEPTAWRASAFAILALGWIALGKRKALRDLLIQGAGFAFQALLALLLTSASTDIAHRLPGLAVGSGLLVAVWGVLRFLKGRELGNDWTDGLGGVLAFIATSALAVLIIREVPAHGVAPVLALLGLLLLIPGLRTAYREILVQALYVDVLALITLATHGWAWDPVYLHISGRGWSMLGVGAGFLAQEFAVFRHEERWPWDSLSSERVLNGLNAVAAILLALLVFLEVPDPGIAPALMILGLAWLLWARVRASAWYCVEALGFTVLGYLAIVIFAWKLQGSWHGVPIRMISIFLTLLPAYLIQHFLHRSSMEKHPEKLVLSDRMNAGALSNFALILLFTNALVLGWWIKSEAMASGKNLLVALAWGVMGLLHLERGRALKLGYWKLLGHGAMAAAFIHFTAVNLLQPGELGGISLRLLTGLPFLGMLIYVYLSGTESESSADEKRSWTVSYLYGLQLAVAMLVLYEIHRAWVLPAWALQALVSLVWGIRREASHWLRCALILVVACAFRGMGSNLVFRDQQGALALNLVTVPLACALILIGYILLRRKLEGPVRLDLEGLGAGINRLPWFAIQAILLFGFIWVEASGTELTVWISLFGLGMVALGFVFQERVARLTGLGLLTACILKLFIYDLRGLTGLSRVLSFIVLGAVLILVSFVYTRFKERLEKLL